MRLFVGSHRSFALLVAFGSRSLLAQDISPWLVHDQERPLPAVVTPVRIDRLLEPPSDAEVLFDGSDLSKWQSDDGGPARWIIDDGAMMPAPHSGPVQTKEGFSDIQLHLEWAAPAPPAGDGQGRGNSGVYLMNRFEIQVLDSYQNATYADGLAGAVYGQNPPLVNACLPPGQWQTFDIVFHRPRFARDGTLERPAIITLFHNGILVQDHFRLWGPTNWLRHDSYEPHPDRQPIMLQDHGNPVRYRNIWVRNLPDQPAYEGPGEARGTVTLSRRQLQRFEGRYREPSGLVFPVRLHDGGLQLAVLDRYFDLVPRSSNTFAFRNTNAAADFEVDAEGNATGVVVHLIGERHGAQREPP
jgi:hypothetical protein